MNNPVLPLLGGAARIMALFALFLGVAAHSQGAVTNVAWYRLGEQDVGAASGRIVNSTATDLVGTRNLRRFGGPRYTNAVLPAAARSVGSSLAVAFSGSTQFYSNTVVTAARDNFGIEAWISPNMTVLGTNFIAFNGSWGLGTVLTINRGTPFLRYFAQYGSGVTFGTASSSRAGAAHVALVRAGGVATLFVNGVASGSSSLTPPTPTGGFTIAAAPRAPSTGFFSGGIDEVRVFTFAPGRFSAADLLFNQQRIATLAADGLGGGNATLHGRASPFAMPTTVWFEWGQAPNLDKFTPALALPIDIPLSNFNDTLTGLSPSASHVFRAMASNALGVATGPTLEFSLLPSVTTLAPSGIQPASVAFNGAADSKGLPASVRFEWGTTTNYGNLTPLRTLPPAAGLANFSETVNNLFPGGTFHFRALLTAGGSTTAGANLTFTTPSETPGDRFLPGGATVAISPPEALADGARWSLNNGPEMLSELVQTPLAPGRYTVRFSNLPNWREPPPLEVVVLGGQTSTVSAVFTPIPAFAVGAAPEQHARLGETVEFILKDTPPGTQLRVTGSPPPSDGSFSFDPEAKKVSYTAGPTDRLPFNLTYLIDEVPTATSAITPLQTLPPEAKAIQYDRPLPDEESRDYISISEQLSAGEELFNSASNQVFTVDISGKTLVFDQAHQAHLHRVYNARENIKEMRLYGDRVIIRSPLELPQTRVTIRARELRFEGAGLIDTTPRSRATNPPAITWNDDNTIGLPGAPGHDAGDIDVFVERFHADPGSSPRFVMRGGNGGPPGPGRDGVFEGGTDPSFFPGFPIPNDANNTPEAKAAMTNWIRLMARSGNPTNCGVSNNRLVLYRERRVNGVLDPASVCGTPNAVARGEPAVPAGIPGAGGRGGVLRSTLDLSAFVSQPGGLAGTNGPNYVGGGLAYQYIYQTINTVTVGPNAGTTVATSFAPRVPGANATAPSNANGAPGAVEVLPNPSLWLHSFGLRAIVRFAKDAYLNGRAAEARALMAEYGDALSKLQPEIDDPASLSDAEFAETASLDQLAQEMGAIVNRIDMNLDFFGNPSGWAPMLSFEANLTAFQNEINQSIPILYLAYWLNYSATNLQNSAVASEEALRQLRSELTRLVNDYNAVQSTLPGLKNQAARIQESISAIRSSLVFLERDLAARAERNVEERNKLPFWKKAIGVLAVAADLIPIGQPAVGKIGEGLKRLTQFDPDNPLKSIISSTNAFQSITNKDVSICFTTSVTNTPPKPGDTNSVSDKAARKAKLKALSNCGKFLQSEFKELANLFKETTVDAKELQAEIEKLKASDPIFQAMTTQLTALNKEKERFGTDLAVALQAIASLASDMTENFVATEEMETRVASQFAALDHNALVHIKEMERRARRAQPRHQQQRPQRLRPIPPAPAPREPFG